MLKLEPPEVKPWDHDRIIDPMIERFRRAMRGAFDGHEVLGDTIQLYCELAELDCSFAAAEWLYGAWEGCVCD